MSGSKRIDRRTFLGGAIAASAFATAAPAQLAWALTKERRQSPVETSPGDCGVASGDPRPDGVTLWTRVPDAFQSDVPLEVRWEVATSPEFVSGSLVRSETTSTSADRDFTVLVSADGLEPFTWYYYRFSTDTGYTSVVGRTLTAPASGTLPEAIRFAVISCQLYSSGWYNVLHEIALDDLHFVVHVGDNVYEGGGSGVRTDTVGAARTLDQWRAKYRLYFSDPDYQEARRLFPWIVTWDDHEVFENYAGSGLSAEERAVQSAAYQAFREFIPLDAGIVLSTTEGVAHLPIHRSFAFGDLLEVFALDGRQYRDGLVCEQAYATFGCEALYDPARTMLGEGQREWLKVGLSASGALWKVLASNVVMMAFKVTNDFRSIFEPEAPIIQTYDGFLVNLDQWDGYPAERADLLSFIASEGIRNLMVVTGDVHNCWAGVLRPDFTKPQSPAVGVEFVGGSISSPGLLDRTGYDLTRVINLAMKPANPHIDWMDAVYHVYTRLEVTPEATYTTYVAVDTVTDTDYSAFPLKRYTVFDGESEVVAGILTGGEPRRRRRREARR